MLSSYTLVVVNSRRQAHKVIAQTWSRDEKYQLRGQAFRLLTHDHGADEDNSKISSDPLVRANCGACALSIPLQAIAAGKKFRAPNYSGWERIYIQAGKRVPANYLYRVLTGENEFYAEGLSRDLVTYQRSSDYRLVMD